MAIHQNFPSDPYKILEPSERWFPADELLREKGYQKLLPPLVDKIRKEVKEFRNNKYKGASETSISLLKYWFNTEKNINGINFKYYFAQREAIETLIYLNEVDKVESKHDLLKFSSTDELEESMFEEDWLRFVVKMATGSGKTKVISLAIIWSYFNRHFEKDKKFSRNFILIAPNIIVLDRLRSDFEGCKIFYSDPLIPPDGFDNKNWRSDFKFTVHIQENVNLNSKIGNLFLTNIQRIYVNKEISPSLEDENLTDYFIGKKAQLNIEGGGIDLTKVIKDVDELMILNDEAHHIHDPKMAWFKSIKDLNNNLILKGGKLSMQIDVTATPKKDNGSIFVQTITDYPLVEAIYQNIVKRPVVPDAVTRSSLKINEATTNTAEKYKDYIHLGYLEWKKSYYEYEKVGKKSVLFIMTDDTRNSDEIAKYLENTYTEFKNSVLTIHTKKNGEIREDDSSKSQEELRILRKEANEIDSFANKNKAIVSVLMLKEGWDVKNVTTIVGLRAYVAESNILPEQTLGRGLRKMFFDKEEILSVIGTEKFMSFVESINSEGVTLEKRPMGEGIKQKAPFVIEIDKENKKKDLDDLDIHIPLLTRRNYRNYKNLSELNLEKFKFKKINIKDFSEKELKQIIFRDVISNEIDHITQFDTEYNPDELSVVQYFTKKIMGDLRLGQGMGYDILFEKIKIFIEKYLFIKEVNIKDKQILRNLSEIEAIRTISEVFKEEINKLTVYDKGEAKIFDTIKISHSKSFIVPYTDEYIVPKKSVFNKIIFDSHFEYEFASFLDSRMDIKSFIKNFEQINFKLEYQDIEKNIHYYIPDFIIKLSNNDYWIVETKGIMTKNDELKQNRLEQWCNDINKSGKIKEKWNSLLLMESKWRELTKLDLPSTFKDFIRLTK
jgi:type III restriction enzyme